MFNRRNKKNLIDKGYEDQCCWFDEDELELKKKKKMNKYLELLIRDLALKVGEKFDIIGSSFNPYHFNEDGNLINKNECETNFLIYHIMNGEYKIKGIKLTEQEIEKLESYQKKDIQLLLKY